MTVMTGFPRSLTEFQQRFGDEAACAQYLAAAAGPTGSSARAAAVAKSGATKAWTYECAGCGPQILGRRRNHHASLQAAAHRLVLGRLSDGHPLQRALQLQRQLAFGSYKTAWLLCAKLRRSMLAPAAAHSPA
jgi:hypothetical protein